MALSRSEKILAEKLIAKIKSGEIKLEDLNQKGRDLLRAYYGVDYEPSQGQRIWTALKSGLVSGLTLGVVTPPVEEPKKVFIPYLNIPGQKMLVPTEEDKHGLPRGYWSTEPYSKSERLAYAVGKGIGVVAPISVLETSVAAPLTRAVGGAAKLGKVGASVVEQGITGTAAGAIEAAGQGKQGWDFVKEAAASGASFAVTAGVFEALAGAQKAFLKIKSAQGKTVIQPATPGKPITVYEAPDLQAAEKRFIVEKQNPDGSIQVRMLDGQQRTLPKGTRIGVSQVKADEITIPESKAAAKEAAAKKAPSQKAAAPQTVAPPKTAGPKGAVQENLFSTAQESTKALSPVTKTPVKAAKSKATAPVAGQEVTPPPHVPEISPATPPPVVPKPAVQTSPVVDKALQDLKRVGWTENGNVRVKINVTPDGKGFTVERQIKTDQGWVHESTSAPMSIQEARNYGAKLAAEPAPALQVQPKESVPAPKVEAPAPQEATAPVPKTPEQQAQPESAATTEGMPPDIQQRFQQMQQQLQEAERRANAAERAADTDPLTGLYSRRALDKALPSAEQDPSVAVLVFDANNFGQVNKLVSQKAGDDMIRQVAGAVKQAAEEVGMGERVFRRGGDEIVALVPKDQADSVIKRAEEIFGVKQVSGNGKTVNISLSGNAGNTFDEADAGLQAIKKARKAELDAATGISSTPEKPPTNVPVPLKPQDIKADPERFQYKIEASKQKSGAGPLLKGVQKWDDLKGGVLTVWQDKDGQYWVVNGHHRLDLAKRLDVPYVNAYILREADGITAADARAVGAAINIAEGRGTPLDAAKFFRDTKMTPEAAAEAGIPLRESLVDKGLALSQLSDSLFRQVVRGDIPQEIGVAIGRQLPGDEAAQTAVIKLIDRAQKNGKTLTPGAVEELIKDVKGAGQTQTVEQTLFGEETITRSNALDKAIVTDYVKTELRRRKRLFSTISKTKQAEILQQAGNVLATEANTQQANIADTALAIVDRLASRTGNPINDTLNRAAKAIAEGASEREAKQKALDDIVRIIKEGKFYERIGEPAQRNQDIAGITSNATPHPGTAAAEVPAGVSAAGTATVPEGQQGLWGYPAASNAEAVAPASEAGATSTTGDVILRSQIVDEIRKIAPVRYGRMFLRGARGEYKPFPKVIRTLKPEDLPAISHELGHHLDFELKAFKSVINEPEIRKLGEELYPKAPPEKQIREGFAEYVRLYVTNPERAAQEAPGFADKFESLLATKPDLQDALHNLQGTYQRYISQDAVGMVKSVIVHDVPKPESLLNPAEKLYTEMVDDLYPIVKTIKDLGGESLLRLSTVKNPYVLFRLARLRFGMAWNFLNGDARTIDGRMIPGFKKILDPIRKAGTIDDFEAYLVARRALELQKRGIETGISEEVALEAYKQLDRPEFRQAAQQLREYQDNLVDWLRAGEIIDDQLAAKLKNMNATYVPFHRLMEGPEMGVKAATYNKWVDIPNPIRKIKGSTRSILSPIQNIYRNTLVFLDAVERNKAMANLVRFAEKQPGAGRLIERLPRPVRVTEFELGEIKKVLEDAGITLPEEEEKRLALIFRRSESAGPAEKGDRVATVYLNGEPVFYQFHPDLYAAITAMGWPASDFLERLNNLFVQILRGGAVLHPGFFFQNPVRDLFNSLVNSKYGVPDLIHTIFSMIKRDDLYKLYKSTGISSLLAKNMQREYIQADIRKWLGQLTLPERIAKVARTPIEALEAISSASDTLNRYAMFRKVIQKEGISNESIANATYEALEITGDFITRSGRTGRKANRIVAFFNASVQGTDREVRMFKDDPKGTLLRSILFITIPSIALYLVNRNRKDYNALPDWRKDAFWCIPTGPDDQPGGNWVFLRKPYELGLAFGSLVERTLKWIQDRDPDGFEQWARDTEQILSPGIIPTMFLPLIEAYFNTDTFTGGPIVPQSEQRLLPQEQYGPGTTILPKKIGQAVGVSPRIVEHVIRGYTGGLGYDFLQTLDILAGEKQAVVNPLQALPGVSSFVGSKWVNSSVVDRLYRELNQEQQLANTWRYMAARGKEVPYRQPNLGKLQILQFAANWLTKIRKAQQAILESKDMSDAEKRQEIDRLNYLMVDLAQKALDSTKTLGQ